MELKQDEKKAKELKAIRINRTFMELKQENVHFPYLLLVDYQYYTF